MEIPETWRIWTNRHQTQHSTAGVREAVLSQNLLLIIVSTEIKNILNGEARALCDIRPRFFFEYWSLQPKIDSLTCGRGFLASILNRAADSEGGEHGSKN